MISEPVTASDVRALRELAQQRDIGVGAAMRARLSAMGLLANVDRPYQLTDRGRALLAGEIECTP